MQCDRMPLGHPHGPILKWLQYSHDILHNGPLILSGERWPVISVFWIVEPLACEFPQSVGVLQQLQCWVPLCLHIVRAHMPVFSLVGICMAIIRIQLQTWMRVIGDVDV